MKQRQAVTNDVIREMSFGGGGLVLAGVAMGRLRGKGNALITVAAW